MADALLYGIDAIHLRAGALEELPLYLEQHAMHSVQLVVDANTYAVAGKRIEAELERHRVQQHTTSIQANPIGDVIADEASIIQLLLDLQQHAPAAVIAIGGGTLHDIVRYAAYTAGLPFLSVPTAPSVDGFNSKGAPILVRGYKKTIAAIGPSAIFADLDLLAGAPQAMVAAGFGDMLGKYTSLFDWKFGACTRQEPYLEEAAAMTRQALLACVNQAALIARRDEEGIAILMNALIESGLAMLRFGKSHPASGSEHHLSHYWEMAYIAQGRKQLLHGAKVGVACIEISRLYHQLAAEQFGLQDGVPESIRDHWPSIATDIARIPDSRALGELLAAVGGPVTAAQLGISDELLQRSLLAAHTVRPERYTLLYARNTCL